MKSDDRVRFRIPEIGRRCKSGERALEFPLPSRPRIVIALKGWLAIVTLLKSLSSDGPRQDHRQCQTRASSVKFCTIDIRSE
jgi:hypothetical protein